uniref:Coiled-coil domain containing 190 n=1 Tax=Equus asinus TaxID=9793 RepID=A0A8C4LQ74_EQUAS
MKRMERHMVRGPLYKHFDLERKSAKQAEARLSQRLQRLEDICLYHMKLLTREQRQLQKELQRLQQDIIKKKFSSYFGNGIQQRPEDVLVFSPHGEQKHRVPQANKVRALAASVTPKIYKTKSQMPPFHCTGLKDPRRSKEQLPSQNDKTPHFIEEKSQAQENDSINPPKGKDANTGISLLCQDQEVSTHTPDQGLSSSPAGDSGMAHVDETRSKDADGNLDHDTGKQIPLNPMECAGNFKVKSTTSTYLELFAKVAPFSFSRSHFQPDTIKSLDPNKRLMNTTRNVL